MNRIDLNSDYCCGCAACASICAHKAITMVEDERGFIVPTIDENKCVDCGLCSKVCDFKKEKQTEEAQRYGVSVSCYEKFRPIYMQKGDKISLEEIPCSKKEGQSIKNQLRKEEEAFNRGETGLDDIQERYGNAGMPKSLVLKGVPIICFEHANIGDNSKCTPKQLDTIKEFYKNNQELDWEKEYFEY